MQQNAKSILLAEREMQDDKTDPSVLQKPLNLGVKNIQQILKCIQSGSNEVKDIILNECNIIYECKICRNLFRSLPNLLSHKRFYCKDHCCESMVLFTDIERDESTIIVQPESPPDDEDGFVPDNFVDDPVSSGVANGDSNSSGEDTKIENNIIGNTSPKIFVPSGKRPRKAEPQKLAIVDKNGEEKLNAKVSSDKIRKELIIEPINGNSNAVFQRLNDKGVHSAKEIHSGQNEKVVGGKKIIVIIPKHTTSSTKPEPSHAKQGSAPVSSRRKILASRNDCDVDALTCLKCSTTYVSLKTLYLHMMNLHAKRRLYYPCPFCKTSYVQIWGVNRHLMTVHKKSKDQANKLRSIIKKRAFLKPFDKNPSGENKPQGSSPQNSSNHMQYTKPAITPNTSVQIHKCSKCNRIFTRKTSRISHEKFCGPKNKAPVNTHSQKKSESSMVRPKRIAEKKLNRDFINSQTLKWRSANKVDTSCINKPPKKECENSIANKLMALINPAKLSCRKCNRRFSNFPNLKRHAAIHLGWKRFKCKHCSFQSYQRSQCRAHIERAHKGLSNPDNYIINLEANKDKAKTNSDTNKDKTKMTNSEKSSAGQTSNSPSKSEGYSVKNICKDYQKTKNGKPNLCQSSGTSPLPKKMSSSPITKANYSDSCSEGKLSSTISIPLSPLAGSRQITTRLSVRALEEESSNFTKFYSTLVTRSTSYPKLDLLLNRQTPSSTREKTDPSATEVGMPEKKIKLESSSKIDSVIKPEKSKHQSCGAPIIIKCNPHVSELP